MNKQDLETNIWYCHKYEVYMRHGLDSQSHKVEYCTLHLPEYRDSPKCRYCSKCTEMMSQRVKGSILTLGEYYKCNKHG